MGPVADHAGVQNGSRLALPPVLDLTAAEPLCRSLLEHLSGVNPIVLEAAEVDRVSTAAIQVLLAAAADARRRGIALRLDAPSEALIGALNDLGLSVNLAC